RAGGTHALGVLQRGAVFAGRHLLYDETAAQHQFAESVGGDRLLEPDDIGWRGLLRDSQRLFGGVAAVGVDHPVTRQEVVPFRSQSATSTAEMAYDAGSGKCVLRLAWRIRAYARPMSVASRPVNTGASTSSMTAEAADGAYVQPSPDTHREGSPKATVVDAAARTGWYATPRWRIQDRIPGESAAGRRSS